jgi:DNA repair exonuclease SbcCD ATPase subunit
LSFVVGAERVISAVAIRAALIDVSSLPKSNIFILDEVSVLDNEYVDSFNRILFHLKEKFDSVFIISHQEALKELADEVIEITRDENRIFSYIISYL